VLFVFIFQFPPTKGLRSGMGQDMHAIQQKTAMVRSETGLRLVRLVEPKLSTHSARASLRLVAELLQGFV
jgi:hypothetical protein